MGLVMPVYRNRVCRLGRHHQAQVKGIGLPGRLGRAADMKVGAGHAAIVQGRSQVTHFSSRIGLKCDARL